MAWIPLNDENGQQYYYNDATGETSWDVPQQYAAPPQPPAGGGYSFDQAQPATPSVANMSLEAQAKAAIPGTVRMISGCEDAQTSADLGGGYFRLPVKTPPGACGACTNAMMSILMNTRKSISYVDLIEQMRVKLHGAGLDQIPQLSASNKMDVRNEMFSATNPLDTEGTGRKRSLFIGICYTGMEGELDGCHNDVALMKQYMEKQGFPSEPDSMRLLMDDGQHAMPTRQNILDSINWLVEGAQAGDSLFFHYSGHGGQETDISGDEISGLDDTLVPIDYLTSGQIIDDILFEKMVMCLSEGVHLFAVMDCCHSGTILDLPYILEGREMAGGDNGHDYVAAPAPAQKPGYGGGGGGGGGGGLVFANNLDMQPNKKFNIKNLVRIAGEYYKKSQTRQNAVVAGDKLDAVLSRTKAGNGLMNLTAYVTNTERGGEVQRTITLLCFLSVFFCIALMLASIIWGAMFLGGTTSE